MRGDLPTTLGSPRKKIFQSSPSLWVANHASYRSSVSSNRKISIQPKHQHALIVDFSKAEHLSHVLQFHQSPTWLHVVAPRKQFTGCRNSYTWIFWYWNFRLSSCIWHSVGSPIIWEPWNSRTDNMWLWHEQPNVSTVFCNKKPSRQGYDEWTWVTSPIASESDSIFRRESLSIASNSTATVLYRRFIECFNSTFGGFQRYGGASANPPICWKRQRGLPTSLPGFRRTQSVKTHFSKFLGNESFAESIFSEFSGRKSLRSEFRC